jgi:F-type H+-transporting ATPase subunit gamma
VSKRRDLQAHAEMLGDLRDVLESMKNLALAEVAKLARTEPARRRTLDELSRIATVTGPYHAALAQTPAAQLYLCIGSERGFCGDFNDAVARLWADLGENEPGARAIVVGSALAEKMDALPRVVAKLSSPAIVEDIDRTLIDLIKSIAPFEECSEPLGLVSIANGIEGLQKTALLPFEPRRGALWTVPPELNLCPEMFVREFVDQYLDAALHSIFATSLLSENRARLGHMTVAIDRLDDNLEALAHRIHRLRQEEITREVESILLSAEAAQSDF